MGRFICAAIAALIFAAACGGDGDNAPSQSPTASASPSPGVTVPPSASPTPTSIPAGELITRGPDIEFPDDMAMIIESGCWQCDGYPEDLVRVYKDASGNVRQESLLGPLLASPPQDPVPFINGLAASADATVIGVSICVKGTCAESGLNEFDPESEAIVYRSLDGGITWQEVGRSGPVLQVVAVQPDGQIVAFYKYAEDAMSTFNMLPTWNTSGYPYGTVCGVTSSSGAMFLTSDGAIYWPGGFEFFRPPDEGATTPCKPILGTFTGTFVDVGKGNALLFWRLAERRVTPQGDVDRLVIGQLAVDSAEARLERRWEIDASLSTIGWWSYKDDLAVASVHAYVDGRMTPFPALVDFATGTFSLISDPFASAERPEFSTLGRSTVHAVQIGPFARVTGTNSCLRVRAAPSLSGEVLACMADGVLLQDAEDTVDAVGQTWARVMTLGGVQGWASAGYLER